MPASDQTAAPERCAKCGANRNRIHWAEPPAKMHIAFYDCDSHVSFDDSGYTHHEEGECQHILDDRERDALRARCAELEAKRLELCDSLDRFMADNSRMESAAEQQMERIASDNVMQEDESLDLCIRKDANDKWRRFRCSVHYSRDIRTIERKCPMPDHPTGAAPKSRRRSCNDIKAPLHTTSMKQLAKIARSLSQGAGHEDMETFLRDFREMILDAERARIEEAIQPHVILDVRYPNLRLIDEPDALAVIRPARKTSRKKGAPDA